jgi:soluble lytic murein transglycosylase-like protein
MPISALSLLAGALALAAALGCRAEVYVSELADGTLLFTDRPPPGRRQAVPARDFDSQVREAAARHGVDPLLVHAVIRAESNYDPGAVSPKGAAGLMQLMPQTAKRYGVADRFDAAQSLDGGVRYLRDLLALFGGDLALALAAYNAGEQAVIRHGLRVPPYAESRRYVSRVSSHFERLRAGAE